MFKLSAWNLSFIWSLRASITSKKKKKKKKVLPSIWSRWHPTYVYCLHWYYFHQKMFFCIKFFFFSISIPRPKTISIISFSNLAHLVHCPYHQLFLSLNQNQSRLPVGEKLLVVGLQIVIQIFLCYRFFGWIFILSNFLQIFYNFRITWQQCCTCCMLTTPLSNRYRFQTFFLYFSDFFFKISMKVLCRQFLLINHRIVWLFHKIQLSSLPLKSIYVNGTKLDKPSVPMFVILALNHSCSNRGSSLL